MAHTPPTRPSTSRLPAWWQPKPKTLPATPPEHSTSPGTTADWWDQLYNDDATEAPAAPTTDTADDEPAAATWLTPQPGYYPHPTVPAFIAQAPTRITLSPKTRAGLYNASAAGAGWALGLYDPLASALADCGTHSISGALVLGTGGCLLIAHAWDRRTRHWWPGIAWAARIPLATAILALALWAPAAP
ncbi:hypothetical protein ACWDUC_06200 [Streptomyces tricolor]